MKYTEGYGLLKSCADLATADRFSRDIITVQLMFVDAVGDRIAGDVLSEIWFWHLPNPQTGKSKLRVEKNGHLWLVRGRDDWWTSRRLTAKQVDRALHILIKAKVIEKTLVKFNGAPTVAVRLLETNLITLCNRVIQG